MRRPLLAAVCVAAACTLSGAPTIEDEALPPLLPIAAPAWETIEARPVQLGLPSFYDSTTGEMTFIRRQSRHGSASMTARDSVRYSPAAGFVGIDTIVLQVNTPITDENGTPVGSTPLGTFLAIITVRPAPPVVYNDPYDGVDWGQHRYLTQLHDHAGTSPWRLRAYDAAGYEIMPVMTYTGVVVNSNVWTKVRWPVAGWIPDSVVAGFRHIKMLFPSGEQVQSHHLTSPFLARYLSLRPPQGAAADTNCASTQECLDAIDRFGGMAFLAHPWEDDYDPLELHGFAGLEIYSAFAAYRHDTDSSGFFVDRDRNELMEARWDEVLERDQRSWGTAVNDHFGPDNTSPDVPRRIWDSGKTQVFLSSPTLEGLQAAISRGAFLSIRDLGATKNAFPQVDSVVVTRDQIQVYTTDQVDWISNGALISTAPTLDLTDLAPTSKYVRARVRNADGSIVYLQPYMLRPRGDADGNGKVEDADAVICQRVEAGKDADPTHRRACQLR